ncbi:hypothetical protein BKA62DRAFT_472179 [Auriculariales sp. MPI-PUGE-AT-0066]|nr:hypothetical protein BKA62DRAFT_472179 [Auriculariales sp. MPI-PUGE-AT-0066]
MHRHVVAIPRYVRGSHTQGGSGLPGKRMHRMRSQPGVGHGDSKHAAQIRLAGESGFRKQVRQTKNATTSEFFKTRTRPALEFDNLAPYRVRQPGKELYVAADVASELTRTRLVNPRLVAERTRYHAMVAAGTVDPDPIYISPEEIDELEILELVSLPTPEHASRQNSGHPPLYPPRSSAQLYQRLLQLINAPLHPTNPQPTAYLKTLREYHDTHPEYQSTKTYNLLIEHAIRHTAWTVAWKLIMRMNHRSFDFPANLETEKLAVRLLIRVGRWNDAWTRVWHPTGAAYKWARRDPLPFWFEFFAFISRGMRLWYRARFWKVDRDPVVENRLLLKLMQQIPSATGLSFNNASPRLVTALVYVLLRLERVHAAYNIAKEFLRGLPTPLHARANREAMGIIHLFPAYGAEKIYDHQAIMGTFESLMALNPELRPSPDTLCFLMRSLSRRVNGGEMAFELLENARKRWGTRVEDSSTRRVIASLALRNRRRDIVFKMFKRQARYNSHKTVNEPIAKTQLLFNDWDKQWHGRQSRRPASFTKRPGQEHKKWDALARLASRSWGKRWFQEDLARDVVETRRTLAAVRESSSDQTIQVQVCDY